MKLILASTSPRRIEILRELKLPFEAHAPHFIEKSDPAISPEAEVRLFAREKALSLQNKFPDSWILGCDTLVALGSKKFGKPQDQEEACQMLRQLSGHSHQVLSALALLNTGIGKLHEALAISEVSFRDISEQEIQSYVESGEPMDKAGAYAIQGGARDFVSEVRGDYFTIVGLPKDVLLKLIEEAGV